MKDYIHKKELWGILGLFMLTVPVLYLTRTASVTKTVVINEVCSNNFSILQNSSGGYTDYLELYNASDSSVSLSGWTLHTESELSECYTFGDIILEPHAYLLLVHNSDASDMGTDAFAVSASSESRLEIPCAISKMGETIYLRNSAQKTADSVTIPALDYDTVYARSTDADAVWDVRTPTPGTDNALSSALLPMNTDDAPDMPAFTADALFLPLEEYSDFPVLSISIPEDDLYGTKGIFLPEHIGMGGRSWERKCQIDYFSAGLQYEYSQTAGIRVGNRSNYLEPLDFNLYARNIYDGKNTFSYDFFGKDRSYHKLLLNHDTSKEYLLYQILGKSNLSSVSLVPCVLFLNGTFYGEYYLTEPLDEDFIADTYQLEPDEVTLLEDCRLAAGSKYSLLEYEKILQESIELDFSDPDIYDSLCSRIDMESLIDCYAVQILLNDYRFSPYHNCILWRSETVDSSNPYADGKWHYEITGLSDTFCDPSTDNGMGTNTFTYLLERDSLFRALMCSDTFRQMLSARITALTEQEFSESEVEAFLSGSHYFFENSKEMQDDFRLFFRERPEYLFYYFDELTSTWKGAL